MNPSLRFYSELAPWWPLVSPLHEYAEEAAYAVSMLRAAETPVREVLELGSGGGHNAAYMRQHFRLTLVDVSAAMLEVSRELNTDCEHVCADMRSVRLGREFDAVFLHDAVAYMTSEADLRAALTTAFVHCRPGGVALIIPDETLEIFEADSDCGGSDASDGRGVRFLEWTWDPDPTDDWVQTEYSFLLRGADGSVTSIHESHRLGVFSEERWLRVLSEVGFEPERGVEVTSEDRKPRTVFLAKKPGK